MFISIAFIISIIVLSVLLYNLRDSQKASKSEDEHLFIFLMALFVALWSTFAFIVPANIAVYHYTNQGEVDYLQSEIPKENPPILPQMSIIRFMFALVPAVLGLVGSVSYVILAIISAFKMKVFYLWTYLVAGWNLLLWILNFLLHPYFGPLPTLSQNIVFFIVWALPCIMCIAFNIFLLRWMSKTKSFRKILNVFFAKKDLKSFGNFLFKK